MCKRAPPARLPGVRLRPAVSRAVPFRLLPLVLALAPAAAQPPRDGAPRPPIVRVPWGGDTTRFHLRRLAVDSADRWTLRRFDACDSTQAARTPAGPVKLCERRRPQKR